jgi:hypothetical protein
MLKGGSKTEKPCKNLEPIIWGLLLPVQQNHRPSGNMANSNLTRILASKLAPVGDIVMNSLSWPVQIIDNTGVQYI